jgi:uncharacterized membrane protein YfcA
MHTIKSLLFLALGGFTACFLLTWLTAFRRGRATGSVAPTLLHSAIGFVTNFFDTLGIGSFAPTTSIYKLKQVVPDELIPGTLNVGHTLPVIAQAFIYVTIIEVDSLTLMLMIAAAVAGAWLGAGVVAGWPRRNVQIGMGIALTTAAALMTLSQLKLFPAGGEALGLQGVKLAIALTGNFVLGALMSLGIGMYAPCMIMISLLGMSPTTSFPVMMGSCAFLMPVAGARFIRKASYSLRAALGLALGGVPAVLIAAFIVKSLPLYAVRWLVVVVVTYTAVAMLRSAAARREETLRRSASASSP